MTGKITADGKRWSYEWNANGSLRTVTRPDLRSVYFEYDALGRRTSKFFDRRVTRWVWDGNTPLHEWSYPFDDRPRLVKDEYGFDVKDRGEPTDNVITWVFEEGTFKPTAKLSATGNQSIITDHLGTPAQMYDGRGTLTWEADFDIYGKVRNFAGGSLSDCPFRYQGQYEDAETGLYYNRFRYYDPESGGYLSQDPIGLAGNNPTLYGYVKDVNSWVDVFGLTVEARSTDLIISTGADANATMSELNPPYKPNAKVTEFTTAREEIFVRVHGAGNKERGWLMHESAIRGLSPEQIKAKFSLPDAIPPTHVSTVVVPAGIRMRSGRVNPISKFGGVDMNAKQFQLLQHIPNENFKNTKQLLSCP